MNVGLTKDDLREFLKDNLSISVKRDYAYGDIIIHIIQLRLYNCDSKEFEVISESTI